MTWKPLPNVVRWFSLADKWSKQTGVDTALILATIHMESGGKPEATRKEISYLRLYEDTPKFRSIINTCDLMAIEAASSYGLMQLMIPTAWGYLSDRHKNKDIMTTLKDPDMNIRYGSSHLAALQGKHKTVKATAGAFNGAGSKSAYANNVESLYKRYGEWIADGRPN